MEALEALARRRDTVAELEAIVNTMKALAGATVRQAEQVALALDDYARTVELGFAALPRAAGPVSPAGGVASVGVVIGSEQGLCGRFNERAVELALEALQSGSREWRVVALGGRVGAELAHRGRPADATLTLPGSIAGIGTAVQQLLLQIDVWRQRGAAGEVLLFGNRKDSATAGPAGFGRYRPQQTVLLPVDLARLSGARHWPGRGRPRHSAPRVQLLASLLQQHIFIGLFRACAESIACEQAARLAAMQRAGRNIEQHLNVLDDRYRRRRQEQTTAELLSLFAGYEALRTGAAVTGFDVDQPRPGRPRLS